MNIYYCDACGKRLASDESAKVVPGTIDKDIICPACIASRAPAKPTSSARNAIDISEVAAPAAARPSSGAQRPGTGANVRPSMQRPASAIQPRVTAQMQTARASSTSRNAVQARSQAEAPKKNNTPIIIGVAVAAVVLLGLVVMLMGGDKEKKIAQTENTSPAAKPQQKPAEPPAQPANPVPTPSKTNDPVKAATPATEPIKAAAPVNDDPYAGLSPKEAYEKRMKEGKIKPPEPPPPMPEKLPEPDDTWTTLFNGKDTNGWQSYKGKWSVQNGVLTGVSDEKRGVSIETVSSDFGDFDYVCSVSLEGGKYGEVWVRGGMLLGLMFQPNEWKTIRVSARGKDIKATVNGQPATPNSVGAAGALSFFAAAPAVLKIKDVKVKAYGK